MNILVTGNNGFLGNALFEKYFHNSNVETLVGLSRTEPKGAIYSGGISGKRYKYIKGDLTDTDKIRNVISEYEITHVYHLAAQSIVRKAAQDPVSAYQTNVMGTVNLLEAIRTVGMPHIKSIVVSTSDKAYGHAIPPYDEGTCFRPQYTYEATKACQDFVCQNYFYNYDVPVKIARCSNIYGPGDPNSSRLIPNTINRLKNGLSPQIYTSVAEYVREWIYVDDVVDAFLTINNTAPPGEAYCVGGTDIAKVKDVVQKLIDVSGKDLKIEYLNKTSAFREIQEQYINASKLKDLGWKPRFSLDEGLRLTYDSYR